MIDVRLKNILACPRCKNKVTVTEHEILCPECNRQYEIIDDIPVMLLTKQKNDIENAMTDWGQNSIIPKIPYRLLKKLKSPEVHRWRGEFKFVKSLVESMPEDKLIVDIGCGAQSFSKKIIRFDIGPFENVSVVGDGHSLPFINNSVDLLFIHRVLEHVDNPQLVVNEILRVLKPGGKVSAIVPFFEPYHRNPKDNQRWCKDGVVRLFEDFNLEEIKWVGGPSSSLVWFFKEYIAILFPFSNNRFIYASVREIMGWVLYPIKMFDFLLRYKKYAYKIAGSFLIIGTKKR